MKDLIQKALDTRKNAYAPYSQFAVGAALEAENGTIYTGCNVENASYGLSICAERTALVKAISEGAKKFKRLAIVADTPEAVTPCGMCRQMLMEFSPEMELILANTKGKSETVVLSKLLPRAFKLAR
ncbi:MAG: cytidine deaminase [Deltaproteobacteria bacterium]|nr:cytidine deaminase [Deltaproteobacteria bacterium]